MKERYNFYFRLLLFRVTCHTETMNNKTDKQSVNSYNLFLSENEATDMAIDAIAMSLLTK